MAHSINPSLLAAGATLIQSFQCSFVPLLLHRCFCSTVWQNSLYAGKLHQLRQGSISGGGFNTANYSGTPNNNINHFGSIYIRTDNTLEVHNCAILLLHPRIISLTEERKGAMEMLCK